MATIEKTRTAVIAMDGSEYAQKAIDCKYTLNDCFS